MIRAFLVEDEIASIDHLYSLISENGLNISIVGAAKSIKEAIPSINKLQLDLLILDIQLPDGTGFDLLEKLKGFTFSVLFTTAHEQHAVRAFKYSAIDFLLKPIEQQELVESIQKISRNLLSKMYSPRRIAISTIEGILIMSESEIMYVKADNNYAHIYKFDGSQVTVSKPLKSVEKVVNRFKFIRTHQSYLVNIDSVRRYNRSENYLTLKNDIGVPVSKSNKDQILQLLQMNLLK